VVARFGELVTGFGAGDVSVPVARSPRLLVL